MAVAFNTGKHARAIREGGVPAPAADAIVDAIAEATDSLVTEEFLRNELVQMEARMTARIDVSIERLRGEMWRAMYMSVGRHGGHRDGHRRHRAGGCALGRLMAAEATDSLVTRDVLQAELAIVTERLRAEMWRAMYISVGVMAAIAGLALAIARWVV